MKYLLLVCLMFISAGCNAADINWSNVYGTASGSVTQGSELGAVDNIKDNDTGTFYGAIDSDIAAAQIAYTAQIDFSESADVINSVEFTHEGSVTESPRNLSITVDIYENGGWTNIYSSSTFTSKTTITISTGWTNVEGVRVAASGQSVDTANPPIPIIQHLTYEIKVLGPGNVRGDYAFIL